MTPLHLVGEWLREALAMVPLTAVRALFVAVPLVVLVWVLALPRAATTDPATSSWAGNLKMWAALALVIQVLIYALV